MTSVTMSRQSSSYSARSISSASALNMGGAAQLVGGGGQSRMSVSYVRGGGGSVYGGAGGFGTRISQASNFLGGWSSAQHSEGAVVANEKVTMQNLNDRLATYLDKVRSLESANRKLELQIREFYEKKTFVTRDFTAYFATISDLRAQIGRRHLENQRIILQMDNAQLATEDFRTKYEMELNMRTAAEADVLRLRGVRDSMTLTISDLEMQIESLTEELNYIRKNHAEEMAQVRVQQSGSVNVEVDSVESTDLSKVLEEMREQYEQVVQKNRMELEKWYQVKTDALRTQLTTVTTETKTFTHELSELKRTYQALEISRQSVLTEMQCLQQNLEEVKGRYSSQLSSLQLTINQLELELQQLKVSIENQQAEYKILLDIKMRLELEIAEYRRLLDGELRTEVETKKAVVISKVVEVEERKPHVERRVKTIVEEIVDGKVVSSVVDTQVEDIQ